MSRLPRRLTAAQKASVVRRHLAGKEAVFDLVDELGLQPSQIHRWFQRVLSQAEKVFERPSGGPRGKGARRLALQAAAGRRVVANERLVCGVKE